MFEMKLPNEFDDRAREAARFFWDTREGQISKQQAGASRDQGNRGAATGGKQLDGFVELARDVLLCNGAAEETIFYNTALELPGYYRPSKKWDLLVVENGRLAAAIEFKSQVGPSFGNNFNNRTEEAMGSALDIWTAYREGVFGPREAPWLGYMMVLEDCPKSTVPVAARSPHFNIMPEFCGSSYMKRYELFCTKLVLERQYSAACFMTTRRDGEAGNYQCPAPELSLKTFFTSMAGAVLTRSGRQENHT